MERIPKPHITESVIYGIGILYIDYFNATCLLILLPQRELNMALRHFPVGTVKVQYNLVQIFIVLVVRN